jgi:hypothetical protein
MMDRTKIMRALDSYIDWARDRTDLSLAEESGTARSNDWARSDDVGCEGYDNVAGLLAELVGFDLEGAVTAELADVL